jgi:hypothetical protein
MYSLVVADDGENALNGSSETQNDQGGDDTVDGAILSRLAAGDGKSRVILINKSQGEHFLTNEISTAKYSVLSFIPSFLFEQFRRYSNIFFLCIALLQVIHNLKKHFACCMNPYFKSFSFVNFSKYLTYHLLDAIRL